MSQKWTIRKLQHYTIITIPSFHHNLKVLINEILISQQWESMPKLQLVKYTLMPCKQTYQWKSLPINQQS